MRRKPASTGGINSNARNVAEGTERRLQRFITRRQRDSNFMQRGQFVLLTRLGFAARGLLYLVIAWLVLGSGRTEDLQGALEYVGKGSGKWLLIAMTAGFIAYGLWRLADAALNIEAHEDDKSGTVKRIGAAGSGLIYLFLAWQAIRLISSGSGNSGSGGGGAQEGTQTALNLPGGGLIVVVAAAILIGIGIYQLVKAAKGTFLKHLDPRIANADWAKWSGRLGYAARGIIFLITGYFLLQAGLAEQASKAGGMEQALAWLSGPMSIAVAVGLALFGIFSLVEARYRTIHSPDVQNHIGDKFGQ
jgi:hypothetical protein